ncbi:MAG: DUF2147 domain-containing protein [Bacteroidetes bacterium HGW-Bacteroidetes-3]|jgi:uncharacterized protein (DUF2147 family)|nr:MAG: DUF2147 domain-containing protein [Bacteroidetes bacterium HGW-Bacteroidetes-3]
MIKKYLPLIFILILSFNSHSQSIIGNWKTIDDETGKERSIVEIYQVEGKIYAKIIKLLEKGEENKVCEKCKGDNKNKPLKGMVIINGLTKDGDEWNGGRILDPKTGNEYKCYLTLENPDKLKVRGYLGFALLGRTQYWHKAADKK